MIQPAPTPDLELLGKPEPLVFVTEANRHNVLPDFLMWGDSKNCTVHGYQGLAIVLMSAAQRMAASGNSRRAVLLE